VPKIDLHVHTSPSTLVEMAARRRVEILAVTDHDTVDGLAIAIQAAQSFPKLKLIPGIELSSHAPGSEVHILGYFIRYTDPELLAQLTILRGSREERARAMVEKLRTMGLDISLERVQQIAGDGSMGRPHIAQALMERGYVSNMQEVFTRYIGQGGPAYVDRHKLTPEEAVGLILKSGGLPVLAHPTTANDMEKMIERMTTVGLAGIEVYYKDYDSKQRQALARLASKYNLIATGGSDYHGLDESSEVMLGEANVPMQAAKSLYSLAREKGIV
jgi:predicted metal-dependent phosphoesterase TrpH